MHVEFEIRGCFVVPEGTILVPGTENIFQLPSGEIVSVFPIIEMASGQDRDDHRDISWQESMDLGVPIYLCDRSAELVTED